MRVAVMSCLLTAAVTLSYADTLYLRDGQAIRGTFISGSSQSIRFLPDGGRTQLYPITRVDRLAFGDGDSTSNVSSATSNTGDDRGARGNYRGRGDEGRYSDSTRSRSVAGAEVPAGTQITVRMIDPVNSNQTDVGRRYHASVDQDVVVDGNVVVPKGADATVEVVNVEQGRALGGAREQIALSLAEINANGRRITPVTRNAEISSTSRGASNVKVIGGTAALGAIIGAIAGGGRGAAIGAASGAAAGTGVQAIRGQKIEIPSETQLLFTLNQPMRF